MRGSRAVMVAGGCAAIVGAGWVASPKELPTLELVDPVGGSADDAEEASTPEPTATTGAVTDAAATATRTATPEATAEATAAPVPDTFDGPAVTNLRGTYQARITVVDGAVTDVAAVVAGTEAAESVAVNAMAIPELRARVLEAQTWDVEEVSGASYTSPAFIESLQGAFADAGL